MSKKLQLPYYVLSGKKKDDLRVYIIETDEYDVSKGIKRLLGKWVIFDVGNKIFQCNAIHYPVATCPAFQTIDAAISAARSLRSFIERQEQDLEIFINKLAAGDCDDQ